MWRLIQRVAMNSQSIPINRKNNLVNIRSLLMTMRFTTSGLINTTINQPRASAVLTPLSAASTISITPASISPMNSIEIAEEEPKKNMDVTLDKSSLSFEEIPGPAILKLWEKYWKYVPLFGTQVLCSLLINSFTVGRLTWTRNVTPIKYFFNEYGPIVRINAPMLSNVVMIHRPEHIAHVFKQEKDSPVQNSIDVLQHYRLDHRRRKLPGPSSMQSAEWFKARAKLDKFFSMHMHRHFEKLEMISDELIQTIHKIRNKQDEVPESFDKNLLFWSFECFSLLIFNRRMGSLDFLGFNSDSESSKIIEALTVAHKYLSRCESGFQVWRFFETPYSSRLFNACDFIDDLIEKYIRQAQTKLQSRVTATSVEPNKNEIIRGFPVLEKILADQEMDPDDLAMLLMDSMILGVQATCSTQAFLLYFLAKNPRVQRTLYDEICTTVPVLDSRVNETNLNQMPYLKACLQETLRLRPALPYTTRLLSKNIILHGYEIPKDTYLIMANEISSRREENFEDPEKFRPERWLTSHEVGMEEYWSYLPFGPSIRSCLGERLAETEIKLLTTKLIRNFKIEYDYADIESNFLVVNVPNKPLRFRFVDRS